MHSHHFIHFHNFIYQRVIYRKISLELCKIWMRQGLQECALTYNVTTLKPPPSWLEDPSIRPCQGSVSGTGSPNFLACHQSLSKGSPRLPVTSPEKAKLRKYPPRSDGQRSGPHLSPEYLSHLRDRCWTGGLVLGFLTHTKDARSPGPRWGRPSKHLLFSFLITRNSNVIT